MKIQSLIRKKSKSYRIVVIYYVFTSASRGNKNPSPLKTSNFETHWSPAFAKFPERVLHVWENLIRDMSEKSIFFPSRPYESTHFTTHYTFRASS